MRTITLLNLLKTFILLSLCLTATWCHAQRKLSESRTSSVYTYIYKASDEVMSKMYQNPDATPGDKSLQNPVDSFKNNKWYDNSRLQPGNYLEVSAEKNSLHYSILQKHTAVMYILGNTVKPTILVTDITGNVINNADVKCNGKQANSKDHNGLYNLNGKKDAIIEISYQGVDNFFTLKANNDYQPAFSLKRWFKNKWARVKRIFHHNNYRPYRRNGGDDPQFDGFMIFNKPKYKPHDTVRFKAYIYNIKTHEPLTIPSLLVKVSGRYNRDDDKLIGTVHSYRPGAYESNFVLTDSLDLDLDDNYNVNLEDPVRLLDKDNTDGKKNLSYLSGGFEYEDYELKSIKFSMRTDTDEHSPGVPLNVYLKAVDENGLPVPDGRVSLLLRTENVYEFDAKHNFIPDTLWQHDVQLDPLGETKVTLPDSIYPKAAISYSVNADFYNSTNEHQSDDKSIRYDLDTLVINTRLSGDSVKIDAKRLGKGVPIKAYVYGLNADEDTIFRQNVMLPYAFKLNPAVAGYNADATHASGELDMTKENSGLNINGWRKNDTAHIKIDNPKNLHFWYAVYEGNHTVTSGEADSLNDIRKTSFKGNTVCVVHYLWGGAMRTELQNIYYRDKMLAINVSQPFSVFPGQKFTTTIDVKDDKGKPVQGADITAWGVTSKFQNYPSPFIPYFGKGYKTLNLPAQRFDAGKFTDTRDGILNWERWSREMGLDTITYFNFTHTDSIYRVSESLLNGDTTTQIAPFVVHKGYIVPVHILYIDEKPVYFSQAEQLQHYSFAVDSGKHKIRMRTGNSEIELPAVYVAKGKKLILSVRDTVTNHSIHFTSTPDTLTKYEAGVLNNYMIKVADVFSNRLTTITQGNNLFPLNPVLNQGRTNTYGEILVGPLSYNFSTYNIQNEASRTFMSEPGYVYTFLPGLLKQKSILTPFAFNRNLNEGKYATDYTQYAIDQHGLDTLWQNYLDLRSQTSELFKNDLITAKNTGSLELGIDSISRRYFIKNIIIYKYDDPDYIRIYNGAERNMGNLEQGKYRLLLLLKKDEYTVVENINLLPHGRNYYRLNIDPKAKDAVSLKIDSVITTRANAYKSSDGDIKNDALLLKEAFNNKYIDNSVFTQTVTGVIKDKVDGSPLPGVTVRVKGLSTGAVTSADGRFRLKVPVSGKIIVQFIGYQTQEIAVSPGRNYNITLKPSSQELQEVVVVGYGTMEKRSVTGAISTVTYSLEGKVAGLALQSNDTKILIRGTSSVNAGEEPLIVIDGMIVSQADLKKLAPDEIDNLSVLKSTAATAIYGARAANGVIVIVTKKKNDANKAANVQSAESGIRKNFSDYAYWQPKLTTDADGRATFTTVIPDDITSWRTFVVGIAGSKATGYSEGMIKSFKPLSAAFISPAFAVEGDQLSAIGKVMNYNAVPEKLTRSFAYNGNVVKQDSFIVANSKIDTLYFTATNSDSLTFKYFIKKGDGYFDGEERKIPVIKQGVEETKGVFAVLKGDTTMQMHFDNALGKVTLHAEASMLPVLMEESDKLRNYKYLCNEQLASKLIGLLTEQRIKNYLGEPFTHQKNIAAVIKLINENSGQQGLWGWWKSTDNELWISLHVVEALLAARHAGNAVNMDDRKITDYLVYQMESYKGQDKITCLQLLYTLKAKVDYKKYIEEIDKEYQAEKYPSVYNHFRIMILKQEAGLTVNTDELFNTMHKTLFGNVYWGEDGYRFFDNSIQLTVMAYQLFRNEARHPETLEKMRGYLLEQRHDGGWRNTYESSLILETILPDVLVGNKQVKAPQLKLNGAIANTIDKFPFTTTFTGTDLSVSKTGTLPIYITGYQQFWNSKPQKVSKDFTVDTWFERNGDKVTRLKGGQRVQLKAKVTAHGDGDFVMVEIPIPAGCSYESKEQSWENNEVHREYFKDKVSIFCRKLKEGSYTFTVDLMPRFSGEYILNPAKAELMYFPVFYGREGMGKVVIGD